MEARVLALATCWVASISTGCFLVTPDDDPTSDAVGASGGNAGSVGLECPKGQGTEMVATPQFCIDRTETTIDQALEYNEFRALTPDYDAGLPASCAGEGELFGNQLHPSGSYPATNMNWCTAQAYCHWRGKRLCGKVGGGPFTEAAAILTLASEWYTACTGPGQTRWPYGASYVEGNCNVAPGSSPEPVGSFGACEGGYPDLFDMSGNVTEWIDACDGSQCTTMGDQRDEYVPPGNLPLGCKKADQQSLGVAQDNFGVRCCWSP